MSTEGLHKPFYRARVLFRQENGHLLPLGYRKGWPMCPKATGAQQPALDSHPGARVISEHGQKGTRQWTRRGTPRPASSTSMAESGGPAAAAAAVPAGELLRRRRGRFPPTGVPGDGTMGQVYVIKNQQICSNEFEQKSQIFSTIHHNIPHPNSSHHPTSHTPSHTSLNLSQPNSSQPNFSHQP